MSQANLDTLRGVYEKWGQGDFRVGENLYDPLVVFIPMEEFPASSHYLGPQGVREFMLGFLGAWENLRIAAEGFVEAEGSIVVDAHWTGIGRESGLLIERRAFDVWTFRGDTVTRCESFSNRADALEAVGLSE